MHLFELNEKFDAIVAMIEDDDNEIDEQVLIDTLESIELDRDLKLDNIATLIERNNAYANAYAEKQKKLQAAKKQLQTANERLQWYMTQTMDQAGMKELKTKNHMLRPRNYKASVVIDNTHAIPDQYMVSKLTIAPDKTAIYNALKAGEEVPGVHTKPNRKTVIK